MCDVQSPTAKIVTRFNSKFNPFPLSDIRPSENYVWKWSSHFAWTLSSSQTDSQVDVETSRQADIPKTDIPYFWSPLAPECERRIPGERLMSRSGWYSWKRRRIRKRGHAWGKSSSSFFFESNTSIVTEELKLIYHLISLETSEQKIQWNNARNGKPAFTTFN